MQSLVLGLGLITIASAVLYEGDPCLHVSSRSTGVCTLLPSCSWAVKERRSGLYPQHCSYRGFIPVVCCPFTLAHDPSLALLLPLPMAPS